MSVQTISENMPGALVVDRTAGPFQRGLEGIKRTGADISVDDPKRTPS